MVCLAGWVDLGILCVCLSKQSLFCAMGVDLFLSFLLYFHWVQGQQKVCFNLTRYILTQSPGCNLAQFIQHKQADNILAESARLSAPGQDRFPAVACCITHLVSNPQSSSFFSVATINGTNPEKTNGRPPEVVCRQVDQNNNKTGVRGGKGKRTDPNNGWAGA